MKRASRASLGSVSAPSGRPEPSPAPDSSSVTEGGRLQTAQCQNPLAVGASGSYTVTAKLLVSGGNPDQDSCGDTSSPPAPMIPLTCPRASRSPSAMSVLVRANEGTTPMMSYGEAMLRTYPAVVSCGETAMRGCGDDDRAMGDPRQRDRAG